MACASRVAEPTDTTNQAATVASRGSGSSVPGYAHALSKSKFRIGQNVTLELSNSKIQRSRGGLGAFAVDPGNGSAMGVLDATTATGPYILDEATHNAAVKAYFISAGIPADQVAGVHATFISTGSATVSSAPSDAPIVLESINSILTRAISGIPVIESTAWAKMRAQGDVDMEMVFWPPIDARVVDQALAFAAQLKDATAKATFQKKLPRAVLKEIGVVIHHTDTNIHTTPTAYVAYDAVIDPETTAGVRHFDVNGSPLVLPQERPSALHVASSR